MDTEKSVEIKQTIAFNWARGSYKQGNSCNCNFAFRIKKQRDPTCPWTEKKHRYDAPYHKAYLRKPPYKP